MEKNQEIYVYQTDSIRELAEYMAERNIQKNDIAALFQESRTNEFVLIYYI